MEICRKKIGPLRPASPGHSVLNRNGSGSYLELILVYGPCRTVSEINGDFGRKQGRFQGGQGAAAPVKFLPPPPCAPLKKSSR